MVDVLIDGLPVSLPQHVLNDGLSRLRSATEGHVGMRDYVEAVGFVLTAFARRGIVSVQV